MKMIVGLGNPGKKYEATRHNAGFMALDFLGDELGVSIEKQKEKALIAETHYEGQKVILVKPQTYMNLSGEAVEPLRKFFKISSEDIIVIYDDLDLDLGRIRIRPKGGTGGHNGVSSIINSLGTREFNRLRIGIGRPPEGMDPVDYVLGIFSEEESKIITEVLPKVAEAVKEFIISSDIEKIMNKYNSR
ncbi:MAG: peptidyl-tRNA hydrolase, family [Clostridia bacterium]|jgi:PTH1 family peptidyl-tRNA hydrolase|nr:peptidyl-tRNA hydrolase [Clostridiales bacterium]MDK2985223.1 peptidyl-tRNA hydrolase, family [Clostridia bacterium]